MKLDSVAPVGRFKNLIACEKTGAGGGAPSGLIAAGCVGADLAVGAEAAGLVGRRGGEPARADAGGGAANRVDGLGHVDLRRGVAADDAGFEEAELDSRWQPAEHLTPGERIELELEALGRPLVSPLGLLHVRRLVV